MTLTIQSVVRASPQQVSCALDQEAAILNLQTGIYYGLDPVAAFIFAAVQEPASLSSVRDLVTAEFEVDAVTCEDDLIAVVGRFVEEGLVEVIL